MWLAVHFRASYFRNNLLVASSSETVSNSKRIVFKIGTSVISANGKLDLNKMRDLAEFFSRIHDKGTQVIVVTSGAIAAGRGKLGWNGKTLSLAMQQASAAVGQSILMEHYNEFFGRQGKTSAQLLLTHEDFADAQRFQNLLNTFETLLELKGIPIVNENDSVTTGELDFSRNGGITGPSKLFGDNDTLSALVAIGLKANALVLLSDVDGLMDEKGEIVSVVEEVSGKVFALNQGGGSGRGGLATKLKAAKMASEKGIPVLLLNGRKAEALEKLLAGEEVGTFFKPSSKAQKASEALSRNYALEIAQNARKAAGALNSLSEEQKNSALREFARAIKENESGLLEANGLDLENAVESGLEASALDRLQLNPARIRALVESMEELIKTSVLSADSSLVLKNGLKLTTKQVPLGVVLFVFENRPNVLVDAVALGVKTGNALILKGSRSARHSNEFLVKLAGQSFSRAGLPKDAVQLFSGTQEDFLSLLKLDSLIDVMVPRGGEGLIQFVKKNSSIPMIYAGRGLCHVYVDEKASVEKARRIVVNAKTQRPGVCNAAEVLLLHENIAGTALPLIAEDLIAKGVTLRCCGKSFEMLSRLGLRNVFKAGDEDFDTEFLDLIMAVKIVDSLDEAIEHINAHGSHHSDAIVTEDEAYAKVFLEKVDSAAVYRNASTRFTDAEEFGLGPELCVSTQKLHARGPVGVRHLFTYKYEVEGNGQVRE